MSLRCVYKISDVPEINMRGDEFLIRALSKQYVELQRAVTLNELNLNPYLCTSNLYIEDIQIFLLSMALISSSEGGKYLYFMSCEATNEIYIFFTLRVK